MTNQPSKEFKDRFSQTNNEEKYDKTFSQNSVNPFFMYGMTIEQYQEGMEIHSKCFSELEKIVEKRMN